MKDLEDWAAVQKVYKSTKSKRSTAELLDISRNTVRKLLEMDSPPTYQRSKYSSKLDPYKEQIYVWRCEPYVFNGKRINSKATTKMNNSYKVLSYLIPKEMC